MMKRLFFIFSILVITSSVFSQDDNTTVDVNELFELKVDSIERKVTINKKGTDTSFFIHYTIINVSSDTLTYVTNSCFYYNHYLLTVDEQEFDLNPEGGCYANALDYHELLPGETFSESEWITSSSLTELKMGQWNMTLDIPVVITKIGFYVDGRGIVKNEQHLLFEGKSKVIETITDNRKQKKK